MAVPPTIFFEISRDGESLGRQQSDLTAIKIGSHAKSHLHLEDPEVGRVHAVVEKSAAGVFVIDLGSGRGTYVNGERVNKKQLEHGDRIKVGETELRVLMYDEAAAAQAEARRKKAIDPRTNRPRDEVLYARRFLARPAASDGSVEVAMLWRDFVMAEELYKPPKSIVVGNSTGVDFAVEHPSLNGGDLELVNAGGGEPVLQFPVGAEGELYVGGERVSLADAVASGKARASGAIASLPFTEATRAKIVFGEVTFYLHRTTKPVVVLPFERRAATPLLFMLFSAALHALLWALIMFLPPNIGGLNLDSFGAQDRFVQILIEDTEPEPEEEVADNGEDDAEGEEEDEDEGEVAEGDEGRAGLETEDDESLEMAIEGDLPEGEMELARQEAFAEVQDRGALAVLNQAQMGPTAMFGAGPSGSDAITAIGAVDGDGVGAAYGTRGLGSYGGGLSGGGRMTGSMRGAGSLALRGRSTQGGDSDLGRSLREVGDRETVRPTVRPGRPEVRGQLDREIIQRVIREHRREIRACYEDELQRNNDLEGRVLVGFVITAEGTVAASRVAESSLNNSAVEDCVARRVRQWRFPEPRGGGTVNVNYPFVFSAGG